MSEPKTLETKAVEILDASQTAIATFADKLSDLAKQYGPDVADAALQMARIDALSDLVPAVAILVAVFVLGPRAVRKIKQWQEKDKHDPGPIIVGLLGSVIVAFPFFWALGVVFDVWRWVGIFEPKLWLAKSILGL